MAHFDDTPRFGGMPQGIAFGLKGAWRQIRQKVSGAVRQVQFARMTGVLQSMTDEQLAQVGIAREDIAQQAAYLVGMDRCPQ